MSSRLVLKAAIGFYIALFFLYLFGPLVVMGVTAVNTPNYPQAYPFEGFTLHWFSALVGDNELVEGIKNSLIIGALVVAITVPIGLAGPLWIRGEHASGDFYIPLATTEGTLVASSNRGMRLLTACGSGSRANAPIRPPASCSRRVTSVFTRWMRVISSG